MQNKYVVPAPFFTAGTFHGWIGMAVLPFRPVLAALSLSELGDNCTHIAFVRPMEPAASMAVFSAVA
jgi:hypothetical protein